MRRPPCQRAARAASGRRDDRTQPRYGFRRRRLHRPLRLRAIVRAQCAPPGGHPAAPPRQLPPAAQPGRPVRLRPGQRHRPRFRPPRRRRVDGGHQPDRRLQAHGRGACDGRAATLPRPRASSGRTPSSTFPRSAPMPKARPSMRRTKGEGEKAVRHAFPERDDRPPVDRLRRRGPAHQPASRECRGFRPCR